MATLLVTLIDGLGRGAAFALIAVSFVIIFRATGVLNFAQPGLLILGFFFASFFGMDQAWPFVVSVLAAMGIMALLGAATERVAIRPLIGRPVFAAALVTVGLMTVFYVITTWMWGAQPRQVNAPWIGGMPRCLIQGSEGGLCQGLLHDYTLWRFGIAVVVLALLGWWMSKSKIGLAMRATSMDQEAALAQGINVGRMFALAWALGAALATLGGILLWAEGRAINHGTAFFTLVVLAALVIGGLDSFKGAVIGSVIIGIIIAITVRYAATYAPWLGDNFDRVAPFAVMILVLLIRPYGLFGTKEVQRV